MNRSAIVRRAQFALSVLLGFGLVYGLPLAVLDAALTLGWHA